MKMNLIFLYIYIFRESEFFFYSKTTWFLLTISHNDIKNNRMNSFTEIATVISQIVFVQNNFI